MTESDFDGSATLVAVIVSVPAVAGAVYRPELFIVPSTAFQVTDLFVAVPWTLAVNDSVPDVIEEAVAGEIDTEMTVGAGATGVTVAQPMANNKQMNSIDPGFQLELAFILGFTPGRPIGIHVYATGCKAMGMHLWEQLHGRPVFVLLSARSDRPARISSSA